MKVFVTGGTGFIGGHVVRQAARARRRRARARARPRRRRKELARPRLRADRRHAHRRAVDRRRHGGLRRRHPRRGDLRGRDPRSPSTGRCTRRTWSAPRTSCAPRSTPRSPKVVYVSTVAAFGNTHGQVVDETYEHPGPGVHLLLRADQVRGAPGRQAADRRGGPALRDRPAGRRLRPRRPLRASASRCNDFLDGPDADDRLPRPGDEHGPRRGRRRRRAARARHGQARRVLRAGRRRSRRCAS